MRSASFSREEVIEKITREFWERGYEATSIQTLEAATGLKRQSLYNAFGNKDAMFELAADHYDRAISRQLLKTLDQDDPRSALRDFFTNQLLVLSDEEQPSGCLVAGGQQELANRAESPLGTKMAALLDDQHRELTSVWERWKSDGKLADHANPSALASLMMALMRGQAILGRSSGAQPIIAQSSNAIPEMFEPYLA